VIERSALVRLWRQGDTVSGYSNANRRAHRRFLLLESEILHDPRISESFLFNGKDGVKDCLKLPSYDLIRARSPKYNTARFLNPASSKYLLSKRDTSVDQSYRPPQNLIKLLLTGF
jgi:hypothetical protein